MIISDIRINCLTKNIRINCLTRKVYVSYTSGPPTRPGGPLEVKDISKDSATLTWKPPEDDGGSGIKYGHIFQLNTVYAVWCSHSSQQPSYFHATNH